MNCSLPVNKMSWSNAIFAIESTVDNYFVEHDLCVYAAALDLRKVFDSVNQKINCFVR